MATSVANRLCNRAVSSSNGLDNLFNPTEEHFALRSALRKFVEKEVGTLLFNLYLLIQPSLTVLCN